MRSEKAKVTCTACGFEWFGSTSAHALKLVGSCTKCHGHLEFADDTAADAGLEPVANVPAHLVLGTPRF